MMTYNECITAMRYVARLGSLACEGCGHEHNCQAEGCAILRDAMAQMEQLYKDVYGACDCCVHSNTPCDQPPCDKCFDAQHYYHPCSWQWRGVVEAQTLPSPGACDEG